MTKVIEGFSAWFTEPKIEAKRIYDHAAKSIQCAKEEFSRNFSNHPLTKRISAFIENHKSALFAAGVIGVVIGMSALIGCAIAFASPVLAGIAGSLVLLGVIFSVYQYRSLSSFFKRIDLSINIT